MWRRPAIPLDPEATRAADEALYRRYAAEPRPNALFDEDGNRRPLDPARPEQAPLREEWMDSYVANGGEVESDEERAEPPDNVVESCPRSDDDSPPPPEPEPEPETGALQVTTRALALCWDTGPDGFDAEDPPLAGVRVQISGPAAPASAVSDDGGIARFEGLATGDWSVQWSKAGYSQPSSGTGPIIASVEPDATTEEEVELERDGLECRRKHATPPPSGGPSPGFLTPIFWSDEPWVLVIRDVLYLTLIASTALGAAWALAAAPEGQVFGAGGQALFLVCLAFVGYLTVVIFGAAPGIPLIATAFAAFLAALVLGLIPGVGLFAPPDVYGLPVSAGTWAGFLFGWLPGRRSSWSIREPGVPLIQPGIVSAVVTLAVFLAVSFATNPFPGGADGSDIAGSIGVVTLGTACGTIAGLLGAAFVNEGQTFLPELNATTTGYAEWEDFLLPFAGERYCVQGHRGLVSHFGGAKVQEGAYDWSLPKGEPLLATKEGHIVAYKETLHGNNRPCSNGNKNPNYVAIRHRDGTISKYLHLKRNSVSAEIPRIDECVRIHIDEAQVDGNTVEANPLHVHEGQVVAQTGDVGISMFPHLHYYVQVAAGDERHPVIKFRDAGVASHGGRCWSMRKYRSSNANRGAVQIPPPEAGGPP